MRIRDRRQLLTAMCLLLIVCPSCERSYPSGFHSDKPVAEAEVPRLNLLSYGLAVGGGMRCRQGGPGYAVFDVARSQRLEFFLLLGDTVYADQTCPVCSA